MKVRMYVEGGGNKSGDIACREGFRGLLLRAGFEGRMPAVRPCGPRHTAFGDFTTALCQESVAEYPILLMDSEGEVADEAWGHLRNRDGWERSANAESDQAQLMVQCMETWCVADREALRKFFPDCLQESALPPLNDLEARSKEDVQTALMKATRTCGKDKAYRKGGRSFDLLGTLNPDALRALSHFASLIDTLKGKLEVP